MERHIPAAGGSCSTSQLPNDSSTRAGLCPSSSLAQNAVPQHRPNLTYFSPIQNTNIPNPPQTHEHTSPSQSMSPAAIRGRLEQIQNTITGSQTPPFLASWM